MIAGGIVDTHLHLWDLRKHHYPWLADAGAAELRHDYLPDDYHRDAAGVPVVATVHVQAELDHAADPVSETAWLASVAATDHGAAVPTVCVGYADLRAPDLADILDRHQEYGFFRGIRQEAWYDPDSDRADVPRHNLLDDPAWVRGLATLAARGLSFELLVRPHQLPQATGIARTMPELRLVLEHTGLPDPDDPAVQELWRTGMQRFANEVPQAYLKISALRSVSATWERSTLGSVVREAIDLFGPYRCVLGSNFPVDKPAVGYAELWQAFDEFTAELSAAERAAIFQDNAVRAYRLDPEQILEHG